MKPSLDADAKTHKLCLLSEMRDSYLRIEDSGVIQTDVAAVVERQLLELRTRAEIMGDDLSGDPAWAMLLTVYVADASGDQLTVSALAVSASCPLPTALRYINMLVKGDWIQTGKPESAAWAPVVKPTDKARVRLAAYASSLLRSSQLSL